MRRFFQTGSWELNEPGEPIDTLIYDHTPFSSFAVVNWNVFFITYGYAQYLGQWGSSVHTECNDGNTYSLGLKCIKSSNQNTKKMTITYVSLNILEYQ